MQAFLNDESVRSAVIAQVVAHAKADEIVKGRYWEGGKGCAVGRTIHSADHALYESALGIPHELARLQDFIFESLPNGEAKSFPLEFLEAIPLGADLSRVWDKFHVWLLLDPINGLVALPNILPEIVSAIRSVAVLYERSSEDMEPSADEKSKAAWDAWDAWPTWAARDARDARATWPARDAWATWVARAAWNAWDEKDTIIRAQRKQLIRLLKAAT